jgi:DNA-binding transcriptional ArsR family regulator
MTTEDRRSIHDPERIRALAHPTRLELLDFLHERGEATATECSRRLGESVASCSFHLRMLGKYGYIEPAARRGREKPWRVARGLRDIRPSPEVTGSLSAVTELAGLVVLHQGERLRRFLAGAHDENDSWIQASTIATAEVWLTLDEMTELSHTVQHLVDRFYERNTDRGKRPPGARRSTVFATVNPDPIVAAGTEERDDG